MNYFKLKPLDRVNIGYLTWNENFKYQHEFIYKTKIKYRIDIILLGLYRYIFNKPLTYDKYLIKVKDELINLSQLDHKQYFRDVKSKKLKL